MPAAPPAALETVLVADRGLVGCRVVRSVQALGGRAVTVHLEGGRPGVGDESILLGGPGSDRDVRKLVEAARQAGARAVHPGAGPLAASPVLARAVEEAGMLWLGPAPADLAGAPLLPRDRTETQCLHGVALDVRAVYDGAVVAGSTQPPSAVPEAPPAGLVTVSGGMVVPHLTPEHVVTEAALGLDLVDLQLRTAAGEDVPYELRPCAAVGVVLRGSGTVRGLRWPEGVRVETACREGEDVADDGVVAVVAASAPTPAEARRLLQDALAATAVEGVDLHVPDLEGIPA